MLSERDLKAEDKAFALNKRRLKDGGWELNCWRMSSPHNYWLTGKRTNSEEHLDWMGAGRLLDWIKQECPEITQFNSTETVPNYSLGFRRGSDSGLPQHTIWRFR